MIELGIHHKQSEYSKQHFAMAILQVQQQGELIFFNTKQ